MIQNLTLQHDLIKAALTATDAYLAIETHAKRQGTITIPLVKEFINQFQKARVALETLGVADKHEGYMIKHLETVWDMLPEKDPTILQNPTDGICKGGYCGVEEGTKSFGDFLSETHREPDADDTISEDEVQKIVDDLTWEDIVDLYDDVELEYEDKDIKEEFIDEKFTAQSRLKKRQAFARMKSKRNSARNIKLRRPSSMNILKKRAILAARRAVYNRFLRGRDKSTLSAAEKDRIEQQVSRMKYMQQAIATKMIPKMRSIEQKRLSNYRTKTKK